MTEVAQAPRRRFHTGVSIPQIGFGVFRIDPGQTEQVVSQALEVGYRHIDTASLYGNEEEVGRAVAASDIPREELFVTTKLWNDSHNDAEGAFNDSLDKLGLDYVDLYLIHWPVAGKDTFVGAWQQLQAIAASGRAKSVGVSNFHEHHLTRLIDETGIVPVVDQVEMHLDLQQAELRSYLDEKGIVAEAWAPLGGGNLNDSDLLRSIADTHGKSPAQVALRWHVQNGSVAIPKSTHVERMRENLDVFDFALSDDEMASLATLDRGEEGRNGPNPDTMDKH